MEGPAVVNATAVVPLFEIAAEFHVEAIREPQLAQQPGHRLTVPPF